VKERERGRESEAMCEKRPQQKRTSIQKMSTGPLNLNISWIWDFDLIKYFEMNDLGLMLEIGHL
jgi:hypothetical protein